jgi:hypothetical protein
LVRVQPGELSRRKTRFVTAGKRAARLFSGG